MLRSNSYYMANCECVCDDGDVEINHLAYRTYMYVNVIDVILFKKMQECISTEVKDKNKFH